MKLDVGCGDSKVDGCIGLDLIALPGVDIIYDLARFPYPFKQNSFKEIYMNDVLEHLPDIIITMEEIHRISKPNAIIKIRVPYWNCIYSVMDPTHKTYFTENTFDFFGKHLRSWYTESRFEVLSVQYSYYGYLNIFLRRILGEKIMLKISKHLCNIIQGLNFELKVIK